MLSMPASRIAVEGERCDQERHLAKEKVSPGGKQSTPSCGARSSKRTFRTETERKEGKGDKGLRQK